MLRVGFYLNSNAIGGLERHVLTLIDRLRRLHEVEVFCTDGEGAQHFYDELTSLGLKPHWLAAQLGSKDGLVCPSISAIPIIWRARRLFASAKLDVIHFHAGQLGLMYAPTLASWLAGIPTRILTLHNPILRHSAARRRVESQVLRRLSRIVTVSAYMKRELIEKKGVAPEHIAIIGNGVDLPVFGNVMARAEALRGLGLSEEDIVVGLVGRLHRLKGADLLIEAASLVKARVPRVQFVLIGSGPEEYALRRLAQSRGVCDFVRFAGYRRNAWRYMTAFDVLALPSRDEAQSIALLEAMACGKAVVAARAGGIPEVVDEAVTGLLFPRENVSMLAQALIELLNDPQRRASMGAAGRQRVGERFSQQEMLRKTLAVYNGAEVEAALHPVADESA
ncbi:MAG TPA: glycosyltransferase family 4 protein [Candidatus Binatia bacterium]|nr:glycosyltransferase family 4 protein [Candidatus Binatia bacterium]